MDKKKIIPTLHNMHCGGACMLNLHMCEGQVKKVTSAGDIPREGSYEADEGLYPIQRRACLLGLSEKKRIYAPDRLKYPMKQTGERGDLNGFRRISWDEALDTVADWYREMKLQEPELGYLPIWDEGGVGGYLGTCLGRFGNPSSGNLQGAVFAAIGEYSNLKGNPPIDLFNSKYIIVWGNDTQATGPYVSFILMKAKEAGIPITVVDTRTTETVAAMGTGTDLVPHHICVRPGTDGALISAMANVIYRKNLHDEAFLKEYCFGFYPNERIVSRSPKLHPVTGEPFFGKEFIVPPGESFIEYLDSLEKIHGGYDGVLKWAEKLTGTPAEVIERFAIHYATTKPSFICSKLTGPQRNHNGMYFSWMLICLTAMTGNSNKRGGGYGDLRGDDGYSIKVDLLNEVAEEKLHQPILFSIFKVSDVMLHGLDGRTSAQLRDDVIHMNGIDLGEDAKLRMDMYVRGAVGGNVFNQFQNVNKKIVSWKKLKHIVSYERFMTSTAAYSDIVLPTITNFEESYFQEQWVADSFVVNGPLTSMYEAKPDRWINEQIGKRLGLKMIERTESDLEHMKKKWEKAEFPEAYKEINPEAKKPDFDEMISMADFQLPVPYEKSYIHLATLKAGEYDTDTGRINFYSPFYAERGRTVLNTNGARYVRPFEGYEDILENGGKVGAKGILYPLQFITPHLAQRALTTYSNIPVISEQKPHGVEIHSLDAKTRGIENGQLVYVYNDFGCMKIPAQITNKMMPGVVCIGMGNTYRPSPTETYIAYFDGDNDGVAEAYTTAVDVGGCTNVLTLDLNSGVLDPFFTGIGLNAGGALCQISLDKPE